MNIEKGIDHKTGCEHELEVGARGIVGRSKLFVFWFFF